MMKGDPVRALRCAIYTRVSTEHGLEQEFNSLDSQREASEAYVKSQAHEGWRCLPARYDDGGFSGGSMERPALQRLLGEIRRAGSAPEALLSPSLSGHANGPRSESAPGQHLWPEFVRPLARLPSTEPSRPA